MQPGQAQCRLLPLRQLLVTLKEIPMAAGVCTCNGPQANAECSCSCTGCTSGGQCTQGTVFTFLNKCNDC